MSMGRSLYPAEGVDFVNLPNWRSIASTVSSSLQGGIDAEKCTTILRKGLGEANPHGSVSIVEDWDNGAPRATDRCVIASLISCSRLP